MSVENSSLASTGDPAALLPLVKVGVGIPATLLNGWRDPDGELWLLETEDQDAICVPLAAILGRHAPLGDGENSDLVDAVMAGLGLAGYAMRNIADERRRRSSRRTITEMPQGSPAPASVPPPAPAPAYVELGPFAGATEQAAAQTGAYTDGWSTG